jgi:hypothetical protein
MPLSMLFLLLWAQLSQTPNACKSKFQALDHAAKASSTWIVDDKHKTELKDYVQCINPESKILEKLGKRQENTQNWNMVYTHFVPSSISRPGGKPPDQIPQVISLQSMRDRVLDFFNRKYGSHKCVHWKDNSWESGGCGLSDLSRARVNDITSNFESSLELEVTDVRGLVVPTPRYWEKLDFIFTFSNEPEEVHMILDASYMPGLTSSPPPQYTHSLATDYAAQLSDYARHLEPELNAFISKQ